MLDFFINDIFVLFGDRVFQQKIGISMGMNMVLHYSRICSYVATCLWGRLPSMASQE
jgi:hypothetical protein